MRVMVSVNVSPNLFARAVNSGIRLAMGKEFEVACRVDEKGARTNLGKKIRDYDGSKTGGLVFAGGLPGDLFRKFHIVLVDVHAYQRTAGGKTKFYIRFTFAKDPISEIGYNVTQFGVVREILAVTGYQYLQIYRNERDFFSLNLGGRSQDHRRDIYALGVTPRKFRIWEIPFFLKLVLPFSMSLKMGKGDGVEKKEKKAS